MIRHGAWDVTLCEIALCLLQHVVPTWMRCMQGLCVLGCPACVFRRHVHSTLLTSRQHVLQIKPLLQAIPANLYGALPFALAPVIGNPVLMALSRIPESSGNKSLPEQLDAARSALLGMLPLLQKLASVLPQDTLLYKLELLQSGCEYMDQRYGQV